jgi:hypothetical protein
MLACRIAEVGSWQLPQREAAKSLPPLSPIGLANALNIAWPLWPAQLLEGREGASSTIGTGCLAANDDFVARP